MPASLARRYALDAEVLRRDDSPAEFTWRGRRYLVREVLEHWWETAAWWVRAQAGDGTLAAAVGDDEREVWRVEAAAGPGTPAVMELSFAWTTGTWTVSAVMD